MKKIILTLTLCLTAAFSNANIETPLTTKIVKPLHKLLTEKNRYLK